MDLAKKLSGKSLAAILIFSTIILLAVNLGLYFGPALLLKAGYSRMTEIGKALDGLRLAADYLFIPFSCLVGLVSAFLLWVFIKNSHKKTVKLADAEKADAEKEAKFAETKKAREKRERRIYLNLVSTLQREGRLIDFFAEDLAIYEDDQIGAAVRGIHESCKKVMDRHLALKPVVEAEEDEEYTVHAGFDQGAIKLIGNVTGEPPFTGIVKHRGWTVSKGALPTLSENIDSKIVAPAEIEVK